MDGYIEILIRAAGAFIGLLALTLFMGRKQLSQITFFDYVVGITIGSIAAVLAVDKSVGVIDGIIALLVWCAMPIIIGYVALKNIAFRRLIDGEPRIVIQNGRIINKNMGKDRYNMGDLLMQLRDKGIFDISKVEFAILEPNGKLSVLKKPQSSPGAPQNISQGYKGLMTELIIDGHIIKEHLNIIGKDTKWLLGQLENRNVLNVYDVMFFGYMADGQIYISIKTDTTGTHAIL